MDQNEQALLAALARINDWSGPRITYEPVPGGITNPNWKVRVDDKSYFVKIPGSQTHAFIDRHNAHIAGQIAMEEGIGPKIYYYFPESGVEVYEWLDGYRTLNYGDVFNQQIFEKIITTIKKFHQHQQTQLPLTKNPFEQTYQMMTLAKEVGGYLPPEMNRMEWLAHSIEESIMTCGIEFVPCHVDHWTANYMYCEETKDLKLVDYEYASMNDIGWDFAAMSTTNYFTEAMDVEWIKLYFGLFDEVQFARFKLYKILSDINWVMWSSVQITQSSVKNFDYHMWLGTKITRLRQFWQDPRLDYWLNLVKGSPVFRK